MAKQDSFKKATEKTKAAGFKAASDKVAVKIDELLKMRGVKLGPELEK